MWPLAGEIPRSGLPIEGVLERFANALSCIDQCLIGGEMLEQLPLASRAGKTIVGGIDLNKARMRKVVEAVIALAPSPNGFTATDVAARVGGLGNDRRAQYGPRHAGYDLKKLRGKDIVCRIGHTHRYEPLASGLREITALVVLRNKAIKPLLAAAQPLRPTRGAHNPKPIDAHYDRYPAGDGSHDRPAWGGTHPVPMGARAGTALTEVRGGTRGCVSLIEVICSAVAAQSKIQYLLPRSRRARLACNFTQFLCQLAVMPTIHRRDGRFRFSHHCSPSAARSRG